MAGRGRLAAWNATSAAVAEPLRLHRHIERQAAATPEAPALVFGSTALTYRELNRRANQLAHCLRDLGVVPDTLVGLLLERGPDLIIAILAIHKAGGAYVALAPSYPSERLRLLLGDCQPLLVLTHRHLRERLPAPAPRFFCLDDDELPLASQPESNPPPLAGVLVRRAARECTDLPTLFAKLAEQVTNPTARSAFLEQATSITELRTGFGGSGTRSAPSGSASGSGSGSSSGSRSGAPLSDAVVDAAAKVLAQHVGPIAKVMARKAASRTGDRNAFYVLLADGVPDGPARQKLLAELQAANDVRMFDPQATYRAGMIVDHPKYGRGKIETVTVADYCDHVDYAVKRIGIDHVGIGSDFDGVECVPTGLEDVSKFPALTRAQRVGEKVSRVGFDWSDAKGSMAKVTEEIGELARAIESGDRGHVEEEMGDALFALENPLP